MFRIITCRTRTHWLISLFLPTSYSKTLYIFTKFINILIVSRAWEILRFFTYNIWSSCLTHFVSSYAIFNLIYIIFIISWSWIVIFILVRWLLIHSIMRSTFAKQISSLIITRAWLLRWIFVISRFPIRFTHNMRLALIFRECIFSIILSWSWT